ncbi:MAG: NAD(P)/FAD-dependent oxidoreductase [Parachlamydiaceae bacterium]
MGQHHVVVIGGGFAGLNCASRLLKNPEVHVTLIDQNNYFKFTPFLYQIATSALSIEEAAISFRHYFDNQARIDIKMAKVVQVEPQNRTVTTEEGKSYTGDYLVLACGSTPQFFDLQGAKEYSFPLYNLVDAERLRSRILSVFEEADRDPAKIDQGVLNFVIVGAGATGTEVAGSLADMMRVALPKEFKDLSLAKAAIYLVDHAPAVLSAFATDSQSYAQNVLKERGVQLKLGLLVKKIGDGYVILSNGEKILSQTVIWAGGLQAEPLAGHCGLTQGHGGRINTLSDLSVAGFPQVYAVGDMSNMPGPKGKPLPQLASVAKQAGEWAARNILADISGTKTAPFQYDDRGIMAMIGRDAAVAEIGEKRKKIEGIMAYVSWLFIHASLLPTIRQRMGAIWEWAWAYFSRMPSLQILDRQDAARIEWNPKDKNP